MGDSVTLYLFDVDDTLILSQARVRARRGADEKEMSTFEFRDMKNSGALDGYDMDYSDFSHPEKIRSTVKSAMPGPALRRFEQTLLQAEHDASIDVGILTARANDEVLIPALRAWMKVNKIPFDTLDPALVFATNSAKLGLQHLSPSEQKLYIIKQLLPIYDYVVLIDDDPAHKRLIDASDVSDRVSVDLV